MVEADLPGLQSWLREKARPRWWQGALAECAPTRDLTGVNKQKRDAVLRAIESLGRENLRRMLQKEREATIIATVETNDRLQVSGRYVSQLYREIVRNVPK
jgi:hypothetical protein